MRKFLLSLLLILIAAGIYGFGAHLPRTHFVSCKLFFHHPVADVWKAIGGENAWSDRIDVSAIEALPAGAGHKGWRTLGANSVEIAVIEEKAPNRQVTRIVSSGHPNVVTRTIDLSADGEGTLVTLTQESETKSVLWRMVFTLDGADERAIARAAGYWRQKLNEQPVKP